MKDGRTRLTHKAEHAVDLETDAVVGVTVQDASSGDTTRMVETLVTAAEQVEAVLPAGEGVAEVVGDKGYHSNETMGLRSYVSEPGCGRRRKLGALPFPLRRRPLSTAWQCSMQSEMAVRQGFEPWEEVYAPSTV